MPVDSFTHNPWLVVAALAVALISGFTGLTLTRDLSKRPFNQRILIVSMAAVAMGGGIWSMHFVAMLGLQLPFLYYYDAAITLASALVAILVVGLALLILHFTPRRPPVLIGAGVLVGAGVLAMHYIGMAALELCRAVHAPWGIVLAAVSACGLSVLAIWTAYGQRTRLNTMLGTLGFGVAVFAMHFIAMFGTGFEQLETSREFGPLMSNAVLALGVVLSAFFLCGAFLLSGVRFLALGQEGALDPASALMPDAALAAEPELAPEPAAAPGIPCEKDGKTLFLDSHAVAFVRADGHYTHAYTAAGRHFCSWPITEAEKRLGRHGFIKTHRSYLVNPAHVLGFERRKDNGVCTFGEGGLPPVPVSRSHLPTVRRLLGV